jgi:hypothetical protein
MIGHCLQVALVQFIYNADFIIHQQPVHMI